MSQPQPDEGADVIILRGPDGQPLPVPVDEASEDDLKTAKLGARERKALFQHRKAGAEARAGLLPKSLTAPFAGAVTNLMLAQLLQGEIVPTTAKEAAEVAKITAAIFKDFSGNAAPKDLTPVERAQRDDEIEKMTGLLQERAKKAGDQMLGGAVPSGEQLEVDVSEFDLT